MTPLTLVSVGGGLDEVSVRVVAEGARYDERVLHRGDSVVDLCPALDEDVTQLREAWRESVCGRKSRKRFPDIPSV